MIFQDFTYTNVWGRKFDLAIKGSKGNLLPSFEQNWQTLSSQCYIPRFSLKTFLVLEKKILKKCFYHIWAWQPSCLMGQNHKYPFDRRPHMKSGDTIYQDSKLSWFWRRRFLSLFTICGHGSHLVQWHGPFEQIVNTLSTEDPMWILVKIAPAVSEKTLEDIKNKRPTGHGSLTWVT